MQNNNDNNPNQQIPQLSQSKKSEVGPSFVIEVNVIEAPYRKPSILHSLINRLTRGVNEGNFTSSDFNFLIWGIMGTALSQGFVEIGSTRIQNVNNNDHREFNNFLQVVEAGGYAGLALSFGLGVYAFRSFLTSTNLNHNTNNLNQNKKNKFFDEYTIASYLDYSIALAKKLGSTEAHNCIAIPIVEPIIDESRQPD